MCRNEKFKCITNYLKKAQQRKRTKVSGFILSQNLSLIKIVLIRIRNTVENYARFQIIQAKHLTSSWLYNIQLVYTKLKPNICSNQRFLPFWAKLLEAGGCKGVLGLLIRMLRINQFQFYVVVLMAKAVKCRVRWLFS